MARTVFLVAFLSVISSPSLWSHDPGPRQIEKVKPSGLLKKLKKIFSPVEKKENQKKAEDVQVKKKDKVLEPRPILSAMPMPKKLESLLDQPNDKMTSQKKEKLPEVKEVLEVGIERIVVFDSDLKPPDEREVKKLRYQKKKP